MRNRGSHKPSGSIADIAGGKRAKPITKRCTCGALIQKRGRDVDTGAELLLTKTAQVRMCGNSVCPDVAEALVRANVAAKPLTRRAKSLRDAPLLVAAE